MKKTLLALILAASALFAVNVSAEEAAQAEETAVIEKAPIEIDGLQLIKVTSSDSAIPGTNERIKTSFLFDGLAATGCSVEFIETAEGEEADENLPVASEKTVTIYTSSGVPNALEALSLMLEAEKGSLISVNLYGTNDNLLLDWTQLSFENLYGDNDGRSEYNIFKVADGDEKFVFYRIDLTVVKGSGFTLREIGLYKDAADTAEYHYESVDVLEAGDTPELVMDVPAEEAPVEEVPEEEPAEEMREVPMFGLDCLPGMLRPVPYN